MHKNTQDVAHAQSGVSLHVNMTDGEIPADHEGRTKLRKALLLGFVEQLQDLTAPDQYNFHPEIERVSGYRYRDGHFKQAALL
jgi:hypothetical protein